MKQTKNFKPVELGKQTISKVLGESTDTIEEDEYD
jgi:hypothetical protein